MANSIDLELLTVAFTDNVFADKSEKWKSIVGKYTILLSSKIL